MEKIPLNLDVKFMEMKILHKNSGLSTAKIYRLKTVILVLTTCILVVSCQTNINNKKNAKIQFNKSRYDFGTVELNQQVSHEFGFSNPGKNQLVILDIKTSCGCTAADWPGKPLSGGEKDKIKVLFEATMPGVFQKSVTVFYNGENSPDTLTVRGKVKNRKIETIKKSN